MSQAYGNFFTYCTVKKVDDKMLEKVSLVKAQLQDLYDEAVKIHRTSLASDLLIMNSHKKEFCNKCEACLFLNNVINTFKHSCLIVSSIEICCNILLYKSDEIALCGKPEHVEDAASRWLDITKPDYYKLRDNLANIKMYSLDPQRKATSDELLYRTTRSNFGFIMRAFSVISNISDFAFQ